MRTAIWSALLAVVPALSFGANSAWQTDSPPQTQQQVLPPAQPATPPAASAAGASEGGVPKVTAPQTGGAVPQTGDDDSYLIGAEDQLTINVWADQRLSGPFLVRSDGRISMNLIGEIMATGKTPAKLGKEIEELLRQKEILKRPQVNVQVTGIHSKKYMINGEVNSPGSHPLVVPTTVLEALVNAGGFKDFANKKKIEIIRGSQRLRFNWNEVIKGKKTQQNILLQPGDIIIVP